MTLLLVHVYVIGPIIILYLLVLIVIVFYLNGEGCCVLGSRLPLSRALERLTIGLRTTSRVGGIKLSFKVESVVILRYLPTRSVTIGTVLTPMFNKLYHLFWTMMLY